jgi:septum formation protein
MSTSSSTIVLGSRSPRRRELLAHLVPAGRIVVAPPATPDEAGFEGLSAWTQINERLREIARQKNEDVRGAQPAGAIVLTADTVIVGEAEGELAVLGQPPETPDWKEVVREWFDRYLLGRPHFAVTAVCVSTPADRWERIVQTRVTFAPAELDLVEWYLDTGESRGKAGGYALQGAGSLFVEEISGSPSNVVGLPLRETRELLIEAGVLGGP